MTRVDAVVLLVAGAVLYALGLAAGRADDAARVRVAEASADSVVELLVHSQCYFRPLPRDSATEKWRGP